jgi:hypothetical protein
MPERTTSQPEVLNKLTVARIVPPGAAGQPRSDVDRATIRRILAGRIDDDLTADLAVLIAHE